MSQAEAARSGATSIDDAAKGCVFGALLGDATGTYLEFESRSTITAERVKQAFSLQGGGSFNVGPAQYTDDGEMTVSSLLAFGEHTASQFSIERHANWYKRWVDSSPFDIGITTRTGLQPLIGKAAPSAEKCFRQVAAHNLRSQSNGSLMRATPLALFGRKLLPLYIDEFAQLVTLDVHLTHANELAHIATISYALAMASMLQEDALGDRQRAFANAQSWLQTHDSGRPIVNTAHGTSTISDYFRKYIEDCPQDDSDLADGSALGKCIDSSSQGWLMYAFTLAFRHLRRGTNWHDAIRETISMGGDTDTNACIVGGMLGCADGVSSLNPKMMDKLRAANPAEFTNAPRLGRRRPEYFAGKYLDSYIEAVMQNAPERLLLGQVERDLIQSCTERGLGHLFASATSVSHDNTS